MTTSKQEVRNIILKLRKAQKEDISLEKSKEICKKLENIPEFKSAKTVLVYLSKKEEVRTDYIIKQLLKQGKCITVPCVNEKNLILSEYNEDCKLEKKEFGVLEPKEIKPVNNSEIDCIIVPGVAFDLEKNRLGHGCGYYDRLLNISNAYKIGIAYDFQIINNIPIEEHDKKMDLIITEKRVI